MKTKTHPATALGKKTVNKLKEDTKDETKSKFTKEKNEARSWLIVMQETLFSAIKCLEDVETEKKSLLKYVELKSAYCLLQIKHEAEVKSRFRRQCLEMGHIICKKDKDMGTAASQKKEET